MAAVGLFYASTATGVEVSQFSSLTKSEEITGVRDSFSFLFLSHLYLNNISTAPEITAYLT